jgi:excisionase family DNA binding protein
MTNNTQPPLTPREAAAYLGVTVGTLNNWRYLKTHDLPYFKMGTRVRYNFKDLEKFAGATSVVSNANKTKKKQPPKLECSVFQQYNMVEEAWYDVGYDKNGKPVWKSKSKDNK